MRVLGKIIGYTIWLGAGALMFIFWLSALNKWLGLLGIIIAFLIAPGAIIFPAIFWIVEGVFPTFYFAVWGIGIVGMVIAALSGISEEG